MAIYADNFSEDEQSQAIRELGERLKNIREAQRLTIAEISVITKIQKRYLEAIESGDLAQLPKGPYVRGFIRQYCEFLSATDLWNTYDMLTAAPPSQETEAPEPEQDYIAPPKIFKSPSHWWIYLVVIVSLAVAGWITWNYRGEITGLSTSPTDGGTAAASRERREVENASPDAVISADQSADASLSWMDGNSGGGRTAAPVIPAVPAGPLTGAEQIGEPLPAAGKNILNIVASDNCWILVSSGGQTLFSGTLKPGEAKSFTVADRSVKVKYGNPSGVSVSWNGEAASQLSLEKRPITRTYAPDGSVAAE